MGLEVPPWVAEMFHVLTGDGWPAADEDEINDLARAWLATGAELMRFAPEVTESARYLSGSGALVGDGQKALAATVAMVTGEGDLTLEKLAAGFEELGNYLHEVALQTQYMKIIVLEELIILAAQIAYLIAMIPWTFGASAGGIVPLQISGRAFAMAIMRQLAMAIATGEVLQVGLDAVAQLAQMAQGWRKAGEWDWNLTKSAAITGAAGGVLGPVLKLPGLAFKQAFKREVSELAGRGLSSTLGGALGKDAGHQAADWAGQVVKGGVHEYLTDGVATVVQGGGWRPDPFSTTAGAIDEGVSGAAGLGGRKGGRRFYRSMLGNLGGLPDTDITIPGHLTGRDGSANGDGAHAGGATAGTSGAATISGVPSASALRSDATTPVGDRRPSRHSSAFDMGWASPDVVLLLVPGSYPGRRELLPHLTRALESPHADSQLRVSRLQAGLIVVRAAQEALCEVGTSVRADVRESVGADVARRTPGTDDVLRQALAAGVSRVVGGLTEGGRLVDRTELLRALSRAAVQVVGIGAWSPWLAAESLGTLFDLAPQVIPGGDRDAAAAVARAARETLLAAGPTEGDLARAVAEAAREVVTGVRNLDRDATVVVRARSESSGIGGPGPVPAPAPEPVAAAGRRRPAVADGADRAGTAEAGPGRVEGWWSGLFRRPVMAPTGLPGNDVTVDHAMRAVPPSLRSRPPQAAPADPVAAADGVVARVQSLMDQFADPAPSLDAFPGRSRLSRFVSRSLPCLSPRPVRDVLTLAEPGPVRFLRSGAPGAPRSRVHEAVHAEVARRWNVERSGGHPRSSGTGGFGAQPVEVPLAEVRPEGPRIDRLQRLAEEARVSRTRLDLAPAQSEMARQAAQDVAGVTAARQRAADLVAYSRLANEDHAGREFLATVDLARGQVRAWADSLAALARARTIVMDEFAAERHGVQAEHEAASAQRREADAVLARAGIDLASAEQARILWAEASQAYDDRLSGVVRQGFDDTVADARARHREAELALAVAEGREAELRDHLASLGSVTAQDFTQGDTAAVLTAARRAAAAVEALDAAHEAGSRVQGRVAEALSTLQGLMLEVATQHPEGFPSDATSDGLRAGLTLLVSQLPPARPDNGIPPLAVIRILGSGLRTVTDDPVRAGRLLDALLTHRAAEFVPEPGPAGDAGPSSPEAAETLADLRALWGVMAQIDRGTEILGIVSDRHVGPLDSNRLAALTVYWRADAAARALTPVASPAVPAGSGAVPSVAAADAAGDRQWLDGARRAAARLIHGGTFADVGGHERAAYTGVLNGLVSVGPDSRYAQVNRWMDTLLDTWVRRAATPRSWLDAAWSRLRMSDKTPLRPGTVDTAQRLAAGFGFSTHDVLADEAVHRGATALGALAREPSVTARGASSGESVATAADLVVAGTWARWIADQPVAGVARSKVSTRDAGSLLARLTEVTSATTPDRGPAADGGGEILRRADLRRALLHDLSDAEARDETLTGVVVRWANRLAPVDGASAGPALISLKEDLEQALYHLDAARRRVTTGADVVQFIDPMVREWAIRQNLRLSQGHSIGISGLALPLFVRKITETLSFFVVPSVGIAHRQDAFVDLQFPSSLGLQLTIGRQRAMAAAGALTVGPNDKVAGARAQLVSALSLALQGARTDSEGVVLRLPRQRGRDDEHRTSMRELLADLVTWQDARDEHGNAYRDRLEFLLAEHRDLTVAPVESRHRTIGADATLRIGAHVTVFNKLMRIGGLAGVHATAERTEDVRHEGPGQLRMPDDQASIATQRLRVSAGLAFAGIGTTLWKGGTSGSGATDTLNANAPPVPATLTRELWQRLERKRFDVMVSGQKMDAEYDRQTMSAKELLAELRVNRLEWIRRGLDSRSDIATELRDTVGHDLTAAELAAFEHAIKELTRTTTYSSYIVRYGPRPLARVFADVFGSLIELALQRDEPDQAQRWNEARNDVLRTEHNWRPRTLLARERGAETRNRGLVFGLRSQTHDQAEVQRTVVQFPPDSGVGRRTGAHLDGSAGAPTERARSQTATVGPARNGRPDDARLRWSWGVIKGTAQPPDDRERRRWRRRTL